MANRPPTAHSSELSELNREEGNILKIGEEGLTKYWQLRPLAYSSSVKNSNQSECVALRDWIKSASIELLACTNGGNLYYAKFVR